MKTVLRISARQRWFVGRAIAAALLLAGMAGCSASEAPYEDIDKAAGLFFNRLQDAQYDAIYEDSSEEFQQNKTRTEVVDNLKQITAMGRPQSYNRLSMTFDKDGKKRLALPIYSVPLEYAGAEITLTFRDDGGEWKLMGFSVKSRGGAPPPPSSQ
jgi:hypothetical protein